MALRADDVDLGRDRALVEQHQDGDIAAFEDLYRRYYGRLFRFCLRRTGDHHEAEELTQEAFARAYRAMPALRGERRFYPWLSVIASRLCIDSHRRLGRTEPAADVDPGIVIDIGLGERLEALVDHGLLSEAMGRVAPRHREVLELREREGWSYQRIAEHYDISMGAVEGLLFRARQALRREFLVAAGPEGGAAGLAAAAPLVGFGWLGRRLASWKLRASEWAARLSDIPGLATNGVGLAMVVTTAAGLASAALPDVGHHRAPVPLVAAAGLRPIAESTPLVEGAAAGPVDPAGHGATGHDQGGRGRGPAGPTVAGAPPVDHVVGSADLVSSPEARERGSDNPVPVGAGPVLAAMDPEAVATTVSGHGTNYVSQAKGERE